jgi:hypothetical protein
LPQANSNGKKNLKAPFVFKSIEALAFPLLFPFGRGGWNGQREELLECTLMRLYSVDPRWRRQEDCEVLSVQRLGVWPRKKPRVPATASADRPGQGRESCLFRLWRIKALVFKRPCLHLLGAIIITTTTIIIVMTHFAHTPQGLLEASRVDLNFKTGYGNSESTSRALTCAYTGDNKHRHRPFWKVAWGAFNDSLRHICIRGDS